jgi:acetyl-CoA carboxylase beta subunit
MDCREFKKISGGYLEDAIPSEQRQQVEDHLGKCPICAAIMYQMRLMRERLRLALCKDCCPGNLRQRVTRKLRFAGFHHWLTSLFTLRTK